MVDIVVLGFISVDILLYSIVIRKIQDFISFSFALCLNMCSMGCLEKECLLFRVLMNYSVDVRSI